MKRNNAEFIREKSIRMDFFQLKHQLFWFWCNFGLIPLTQLQGPQKAIVDLGLGQHREATGSSSSAPLSLVSHPNSLFLS